jgi:uncharacterized protein (TIGR02646 family)
VVPIRKGAEPPWLVSYRKAPNASFDHLTPEHKQELRDLLVKEQRGLCCYCMSRIDATRASMKVEHWAPQSKNPEKALSYGNLLASCKGGDGGPTGLQHCDTKKGDASIKLHPTNAHLLQGLRYPVSGRIEADGELQHDLEETLNLNIVKLCRNRQAARDAYIGELRKKHPGPWSADLIERERRILESKSTPYEGVLRFWLEKKRRQR